MKIIDRVAASLSSPTTSIDAQVFEECATALLAPLFPGLVPIRGGTDWGRDADLIVSAGEPPMRMTITSSRSIDGALANLRRSLKSLSEHGLATKSIVAVSLAQISQLDRIRFEKLATRMGFRLEMVVDRPFFVDRLLRDGEWRTRLLGLPGGPFSLSTRSVLAPVSASALVGRGDLQTQLSAASSDVIVWGPPGVGKSFLLADRDNTYFVEGRPADDQLLNDILETQPSCLIIDDAMRRPEVVEQLRLMRRQESLEYRLILVCWPHELDQASVILPGSERLEVLPLARPEIAEIARSRGITHPEVLARLLDQAHGRPGWAARLIDLLLTGAEWQTFYSGEALKGEVVGYLTRAGLPREAQQLLAVIAALGYLSEADVSQLSASLGWSALELSTLLNQIAIGGLLDVSVDVTGTRYAVAPAPLAVSLVAETYFTSTIPAIPLQDLFEKWVDRRTAIATRLAQVALLGTAAARALAEEFCVRVIENPELPGDRGYLFHHALRLNAKLALRVLDAVQENLFELSPERSVSFFAEAVVHGGADAGVDRLLNSIVDLEGTSLSDQRRVIAAFSDAVRGFGPTQTANIEALKRVAKRAMTWRANRIDSRSLLMTTDLICQLSKPGFNAVWQSVESRMAINLASAILPLTEMNEVLLQVWTPLSVAHQTRSKQELAIHIELISSFALVAGGRQLEFGTTPTHPQSVEARRISQVLTRWVSPQLAASPALRAQLRNALTPTGATVEEPDEILVAMNPDGHRLRSWPDSKERRADIVAAAGDLRRPTTHLLRWLRDVKSDFEDLGSGSQSEVVRAFLFAVGQESDELSEWVEGAVEWHLFPEASVLIDPAYRAQELDDNLTDIALQMPGGRSALIQSAVWSQLDLPEKVTAGLREADLGPLEWPIRGGHTTEANLRKLLTKTDVKVRAGVALLMVPLDEGRDFPPKDLETEWRRAIAALELPLAFQSHVESEVFERLLDVAPDAYESTLTSAVIGGTDRQPDWASLNFFEGSAHLMAPDAKKRVLRGVKGLWQRDWVFRLLRGPDLSWPRQLLEEGEIEPDLLLSSFDGLGAAPPLDELARLLIPMGVDAKAIATRIQFGSHTGEEHEVIAGHLAYFRAFTESEDAYDVAFGEAGLELFTPLHAQAVRAALRENL